MPRGKINRKGSKDVVKTSRPLNLEEEKRFFFANFNYNPQFRYEASEEKIQRALNRYEIPADKYVAHSKRVLENVLKKYGSYEGYRNAGGECIDELTCREVCQAYLSALNLEDVSIVFDDALVARASVTTPRSNPTLNLRKSGLRQHWIGGMLNHEIGTHYLRDLNEDLQPWRKRRDKFRMEDKNPTEEGLAALHTVLEIPGHDLWRPAVLYYSTWFAATHSFAELFAELGKYVQDPDERWDYCVRAKRGLANTSEPGGLAKDQVYMHGAIELLELRRNFDFSLLYVGKVSHRDAFRLAAEGLSRLDRIQLPHFMSDRDRYYSLLDEIVADNNLHDLLELRTPPALSWVRVSPSGPLGSSRSGSVPAGPARRTLRGRRSVRDRPISDRLAARFCDDFRECQDCPDCSDGREASRTGFQLPTLGSRSLC
jgi:hypothetical protein